MFPILLSREVRCANLLFRRHRPAYVTSRWQSTYVVDEEEEEMKKELSFLPWQYLRAMDPIHFDPQTHQRNVAFDPKNGKPRLVVKKEAPKLRKSKEIPPKEAPVKRRVIIISCKRDETSYHVTWSDGRESQYPIDWVHSLTRTKKKYACSKRILWTGMKEQSVRSSRRTRKTFSDVIADETAALDTLYHYGFVLITGTPVNDGGVGIAALASALGGSHEKHEQSLIAQYRQGKRDLLTLPHGTDGPLRTLYGTVWSTSSTGQAAVGASTADSSYGCGALPLHTDLTYYASPPGLQLFTMVQPATSGGATVLADGFAAAERLRSSEPEAFAFLSGTPRRYRCIDEGWHLQATGPVIQVDDLRKIVQIRHNDLDRMPDLPVSENGADAFYEEMEAAHEAWDRVLADDSLRLVIQLKPEETLVVANQRCLHGRFSFEASAENPRIVMGCYVGQEELSSRFRMMGFKV